MIDQATQAPPHHGVWTAEKLLENWLDLDFERDVRQTLRIASELGYTRVFAGGVWWAYKPYPETP